MAVASKTKPSTPRLSEAARHVVIPTGIATTGWPAVESKAAELGITYDPWQQGAGRIALGKRVDGKYAATVGGITLSIPRQVGKTFWVGSLLLAMCLLFPGLKVIWTAHRTRTATNTFKAMQGLCRRRKVAPHIAHIRTANGEQEIAFRNGSVIMFGAREQGFGRGFDVVDVEVFDEAQILTEKALEDMVPATNQSQHPHGALLFFIGTPPRPVDPGEAFTIRRRRALDGKTRDAVYLEFSADPDADPDDHDQWRKANPSFPHRTPLESMLRMRENLGSDDAWLREALGIWDSAGSSSAIDVDAWAALTDRESKPEPTPMVFSVAVPVTRASATISMAGVRPDGLWHVEDVAFDRGTSWVPKRLAELKAKFSPAAFVIDPGSPSGALLPDIEREGIEPELVTGREYAQACGAFYDAVMAERLRHRGRAALNVSVDLARQRRRGDAWVWQSPAPEKDIAPLVAATLALYGLSKHQAVKPKSGRAVFY